MHYNINWKIVYNDETEFNQINEDGTRNKYSDIDRTKIDRAEIYLGNKLIHTLVLKKDQRLIMRYRIQKQLKNGRQEDNFAMFLVGWQQTVDGKNIQKITYILPDGTKKVSGKFNEKSALYAKILLRDDEK